MDNIIPYLVWLFYNTIIPLFSIGVVLLTRWFLGKALNWEPLFRDGQLCFYSTAVAAVALKDFAGDQGKTNLLGKWEEITIAGFIGLILLGVVIFCIVTFFNTELANDPVLEKRAAIISLLLCVSTTVWVILARGHVGLL